MTDFTGAGDISGDGHVDLLVKDPTGTLWSYRGTGDGHFLKRRAVGIGWSGLSLAS